MEEIRAEWKKVMYENNEFFDNFYLNMSEEEHQQFAKNMTDAEKASLVAKMKDWQEKVDKVDKRRLEKYEEEPVAPKLTHTH